MTQFLFSLVLLTNNVLLLYLFSHIFWTKICFGSKNSCTQQFLGPWLFWELKFFLPDIFDLIFCYSDIFLCQPKFNNKSNAIFMSFDTIEINLLPVILTPNKNIPDSKTFIQLLIFRCSTHSWPQGWSPWWWSPPSTARSAPASPLSESALTDVVPVMYCVPGSAQSLSSSSHSATCHALPLEHLRCQGKINIWLCLLRSTNLKSLLSGMMCN